MLADNSTPEAEQVRAAAESPPPLFPVDPTKKEIALDMGNGMKMEIVLIPSGEFLMGSPDSD